MNAGGRETLDFSLAPLFIINFELHTSVLHNVLRS